MDRSSNGEPCHSLTATHIVETRPAMVRRGASTARHSGNGWSGSASVLSVGFDQLGANLRQVSLHLHGTDDVDDVTPAGKLLGN